MGEEITASGGRRVSGVLSKLRPYLLMVGLQIGAAGMYIVSMVSFNHGMSRYVLIVYRNAVAALAIAPFALVLERKIRPKMTISVFLKIVVLGFLEPILDQNFAYLGMEYTSASFTSAVMNAVPAVTFIIAILLRIERVKIKEARSQAKVIGTLVTLAGALMMTMYKGPIVNITSSHSTGHHGSSGGDSSNKHWLSGTIFILIACFAWSFFYILQSITVKSYRAELSLTCLICMMGTVESAAVALVVEHHPRGWSIGWNIMLLAPLYLGIVSSAVTYYVQGLVMKTRGPVFVTAFNPLCMVIVAALGSLILAEQLHLGSIIGALIIAVGLYCVVWGKGKDHFGAESGDAQKGQTHGELLPVSAAAPDSTAQNLVMWPGNDSDNDNDNDNGDDKHGHINCDAAAPTRVTISKK